MQFSIPASVTRTVSRQILITRKHSPTILFGAGVMGFLATTVTAARATLKVEDVLDIHKEDIEKTQLARTEFAAEYSEMDYRQDVTIIYIRTIGRMAKLYGPTVILGVTSIACLTKSHNILTQRYAAMTAAYTALDKGFRSYRQRVVEEFGEDKDRELRYGSEERTIVEEGSKGQIKKKQVQRVGPDGASIYARFFDDTNSSWSPAGEYNLMFLSQTQKFATQKLMANGHLFLNEVYDSLNLPRTPEGAVVGWLYNVDGYDSYVDFGILDDSPDKAMRLHDFVVGRERSILLDFNVGGPIWNKIGRGVN